MADRIIIDADGMPYRELNVRIREAVAAGTQVIDLHGVRGQRFIGNAVEGDVSINILGVPGQDLGAFMRGPHIRVQGNAQDGVGNTMDGGHIVIDGMAGDVLGYAMRDGSILVRGDVGYRVGIHMKSYLDRVPVIVVGGKAGDFLGEYMAGGVIVLLGMDTGKPEAPVAGRSLGTGMHGGVIYIRGEVPEHLLGPGLALSPLDEEDGAALARHVQAYADAFGQDAAEILGASFVKVHPRSHRPYGNMYVGTN